MNAKPSARLLLHRIPLILGIVVLMTLFTMQTKSAHAESPAFLRIVHAAPGIGTVDVFLDGQKLLNNFQFGTVTDYATIPPGPHKVQVALIGQGVNATVITQMLTVNSGAAYTVSALGTQATGFWLDVFTDNNLISPGMAKLRIYHLSPGIGTVNVSDGNNTLVTGLSYPQASDYLTIPAGPHTFYVTSTQPGVTLPVAATLQKNMITSVFAVGIYNGTPDILFIHSQIAGMPSMPHTGSDPRPVPAGNSQPIMPWLFGSLLLVVVSVGVAVRRRNFARQEVETAFSAIVRSHTEERPYQEERLHSTFR